MAVDKLVDSSQLNSDLTSVANAIRAKGGTSASLAFPSDFITAIENISGGGASNVVMGTFTGATSEKGSAKSITVQYTGSGYPIAGIIFPSYGTYKSGTDVYTSTTQKSIIEYAFSKANTGATPDFTNTNVEKNQVSALALYKNSSSDATNYAASQSRSAQMFTSNTAVGNTATNCLRFSSATAMTVFIKNPSDSNYGFFDSVEYTYIIIYSS